MLKPELEKGQWDLGIATMSIVEITLPRTSKRTIHEKNTGRTTSQSQMVAM
jgi:hypothetical protein